MPWRGLRPVSTLRRSALTAHTHNFIGTDAPRGFSAIGAAPAGTFNALTGTPLARLRHKARWLDFLQTMQASLTVRQSARDVGVHRNTSFRWRHRFLAWSKNDRPEHLHGITEADETYFSNPVKEPAHLTAQPASAVARRPGEGFPANRSACWWRGTVPARPWISSRAKGPISKAQLRECLPSVLDEDVLLVSDANASYHYFAKDAGVSHEAVNLSAGTRVKGAFHVQNVNAYHSRLRQWIQRFHGVATHYLPNYLGWRRHSTRADLIRPTRCSSPLSECFHRQR